MANRTASSPATPSPMGIGGRAWVTAQLKLIEISGGEVAWAVAPVESVTDRVTEIVP